MGHNNNFNLSRASVFSRCLVALLLMLLPSAAFAQSKVTGTVIDGSNGEPIIGATIKIKGGSNGAVTDLDGNFTIDAEVGQTLEISYIGYATLTAKVPATRKLSLSLS